MFGPVLKTDMGETADNEMFRVLSPMKRYIGDTARINCLGRASRNVMTCFLRRPSALVQKRLSIIFWSKRRDLKAIS
jgi:hypothetical protein